VNNKEDPQGIYTELLEEMKLLRERVKENSEEREVESLSALTFEELKEGLKISGVLLAEGVHNGIFYPGSEIQKMVKNYKKNIIGMDMTVEHEKTDEYGDRKVGKVTHVEFNPTLNAALYSAEITDEDAVNDIEGNKFGATSMRIKERKVTVGDFTKAVDLTPMNNTLTQFPACTNCNVFHIEDLSLKYYGIREGDEKEMDKEVTDTVEDTEELQYKCPICNSNLNSYQLFLKHWEEEHRMEYGKYDTTYFDKVSKELLQDLTKDILGEQEDKEKEEMSIKELAELLSAYTKCIGKCMKGGKSMKECYEGCKGELSVEEHGATEAETKAMKTRCAKYPISPKVEHGGNVTKPGQYASVSEDMFADPCNYKYPMDDAHIMAAWAYASKPENKTKGGYSDAEWSWMRARIKKRMKATGHKVTEKSEELEEDTNKEGTEEVEEGETELKRTRCPYCKELYESLSKHLSRCDKRKSILTKLFQCNFCEKNFKHEKELVEHLGECNDYKLAQAELSKEEKEGDKVEEEKVEEKVEEKKETEKETKVEESKETETKEEEVKETKEEEKKVPEAKEEAKEETKESEEKVEEKIVEEKPEPLTPKEAYDKVMKSKESTIDKAVKLMLEGEKDRWE